jgi:hypothetical protein
MGNGSTQKMDNAKWWKKRICTSAEIIDNSILD